MDKIKRFSLFFRIVFQLLFFLVPLTTIVTWLVFSGQFVMPGGVIHFSFIPTAYDHHILHTLSTNEKHAALAVSIIPTLIIMYILTCLIRLFKLYEKGEIFTLLNVKYIRNIAYALLLTQLVSPFYEAIMGAVLTWHNPPGHGIITITFDQTNLGVLAMAFIIILISWVMAEGCKLREEQQLTI